MMIAGRWKLRLSTWTTIHRCFLNVAFRTRSPSWRSQAPGSPCRPPPTSTAAATPSTGMTSYHVTASSSWRHARRPTAGLTCGWCYATVWTASSRTGTWWRCWPWTAGIRPRQARSSSTSPYLTPTTIIRSSTTRRTRSPLVHVSPFVIITSMSVLLIVAPWWVTVIMPTGQTDWQMDGRQTITLRLPLDAASVTSVQSHLAKGRIAYLSFLAAANGFVRSWPRLIHSYLDPSVSFLQTASRSVQSILHSRPVWPTYTHTDRQITLRSTSVGIGCIRCGLVI